MIKLRIVLHGVLLITLLVACNGGSAPTDAEYVKRAQDHLDDGQLREAVIELKNAVQKNPGNAQARWLLGKTQLEIGNAAAAEKELARARELGVVDESVLPLLARAWLEQAKFEQVLKVELSSSLSPGTRAELLAAQGSALLSQNLPEAAAGRFEQALSAEPTSLAALTGMARLLAAKRDLAEARQLLTTAFETDQTYAPAWSLLGDIELLEQRPKEAEAAYTQAIKYRAGNKAARLKRATVRIELQEFDKAQADLDVLNKQAAEHPDFSYIQGLLYFQQKRYPEAREALQLTLSHDPQHLRAMFYIGAIQFAAGNREQAKEMISRFARAAPGYIPGRKLLAFVKVQEGDYAGIEKLMRPVVAARNDDVLALKLLAFSLLKQGKSEEGIKLLEKAAELQPESAVAQASLGESLLILGDQTKGMEHLQAAIGLDPRFQQADVVLILSYLRQNEFDKALEAAHTYQERNPGISGPLNLLGRVHLARGQRKEAEKAFDEAQTTSPGDIFANHSLAALALERNELEQARSFFEAVLVHHPDHLQTLLELSALDARENKQEPMVQKLETAAAAHPNVLRPRIVLARYYIGIGKPAKVPVVLGDLRQTHADDPQVLEVLGLSQLAQNAAANARITLERLAELQPESARAHFLLSQAHARLGDGQNLEAELGKALKIDPTHFGARLSLTRLQLLVGKTDQARNNLAILKKQAPDDAEVLYLEGTIARGSGKPAQALDSFEKVFEQASSTRSMLTLAKQKWGMGDRDGSLALQEKWVAEHPEDLAARLELANTYIALERTDAALEQYKKVLKYSENNLVALNNFAWYRRKSDPKQALKYAEKAYALAPKSAPLMDTLGIVLLHNGDTDTALRMIERALDVHPDNPSFLYHKAMVLEAAGQQSEAVSLLAKIVEGPLAFPQRPEAEEMLARLRAE